MLLDLNCIKKKNTDGICTSAQSCNVYQSDDIWIKWDNELPWRLILSACGTICWAKGALQIKAMEEEAMLPSSKEVSDLLSRFYESNVSLRSVAQTAV